MAVAAALAVWPAVGTDDLGALFTAVGACAVVLLVVSLGAAWSAGIAWAVALLAGEYAGSLAASDDQLDARAVIYATGLVLLAELAYWSLGRGVPGDREVAQARVQAMVLIVPVSLGAAALVFAATSIPIGRSPALEAGGAVAAVALISLLAILAWWRRMGHSTTA